MVWALRSGQFPLLNISNSFIRSSFMSVGRQMSVEERLRTIHSGHRILTIQSHVVHGYAGNRCSVFPLQLHGFEVDIINSVQFSNHTGYKEGVKGYRLAEKDLGLLYEGLKLNDINYYSHVMSGYCGDASFLREICAIVQDLKAKNSDLIYVCDPVLGDNDKYYVPAELCGIYRDEIFLLADIITPNTFELSQLSNMDVKSEADCLAAVRRLHKSHPHIKLIVVTSGILAEGRDDIFYCYASQRADVSLTGRQKSNNANAKAAAVFRFEIPVVQGQYVGTGDLFTSLLVTWLEQTAGDVPLAVGRVISSIQALLRRTHDFAYATVKTGETPSAQQREIQLVQSRYDLLMPADDVKYARL